MSFQTQNPIALNLERLSKQYNTILTEYTQTQTDYIDYISSLSCKNPSCASLSTLPGHTYYGTKTLQTTSEDSVDACVALCPNISGCSGGTFNSSSKNCQLVSGTGTVNAGIDTDYAIITEDKIYLQKLQSLNQMLTDINAKILALISSGQQVYHVQDDYRAIQTSKLQENSQSLDDERAQIEQRLRELHEVNAEQDISAARTMGYYYSYILFIFFVINSFFIMVSFGIGKETMFADTFRQNLFRLIFFEILFFFLFIRTSFALVFLFILLIITLKQYRMNHPT